MRHLIAFSAIVALALSSCSLFEEEARPATTIWNTMAGSWKVDHTYSINGLQFGVSECTKEVIYQINMPTDNQYEELPKFTDLHEWLFGKGNFFIRMENHDPECRNNDNPERYDFFIPMRRNSWNDVEEDLSFSTTIDLPGGKASGLTPGHLLNREFIIKNFDARLIGLENDRMDFQALYDVYGRRINGETVYDTVHFSLIRTNVSPTFVIEEFTPDKFEIYEEATFARFGCGGDDSRYHFGGIFERCAYFDGTYGCDGGSDFDTELEKVHRFTSNGLTYSFWIRPKSVAKPEQILFSKYDGQYGPYKCSLLGDKVALFVNDGFGALQQVTTSGAVTPGQWNHICITVLDNFITIYLNGQPDVIANNLDMLSYDSQDADFYLGSSEYNIRNNATSTNYEGHMDEFILYEEYMVPGVVKNMYEYYLGATYNPEADFLPDYDEFLFENISNSRLIGNAREESGGVIGNCVSLDGNGDAYAPYGNIIPTLHYEHYWLMSFWIKPGNTSRDTQVIASHYNPEYDHYPNTLYRLYLNKDKLVFSVFNTIYGGYLEVKSQSGLTAGQWAHAYISVEKGEVKMYLDGELEASRQLLPYEYICGGSSSDVEIYFGTTDWHYENGITTQDFNGKIDEFRIYKVSETQAGSGLTEMELRRIHQWYLENGNI